jgi:molybdate transport system permease protein
LNWPAVLTSLKLAAVTTLVLLVVGIPLAYWLSFSRKRWTFLIESVVALPLILPPTVLGFYVLVALGPRSPIGRAYENLFGSTLPFTFKGLVIASVIYSLPFAVQPIASSFGTVSRRLIEASWTLGVSRWGTFRRVIVPQSIGGLITGAVLSFAHTIGEFGVVLMVGGNIQGETRTISIAIYDDVQSLNYAQANATALFLLVFSFVILATVYAVNRQAWTAFSVKSNAPVLPAR